MTNAFAIVSYALAALLVGSGLLGGFRGAGPPAAHNLFLGWLMAFLMFRFL